MSRQFSWTLAEVSWSPYSTFIRGYINGLPLVSRNCAPRNVLATRRQLRALGKRPGGQDPVAVLYTKHTPSGTCNWSSLWLIEQAVPVRPMTPARWSAIGKALAARRTCGQCGDDTGVYLPRERRLCEPCRYELNELEPWDYLHDYVHHYRPDEPIIYGYTPETISAT